MLIWRRTYATPRRRKAQISRLLRRRRPPTPEDQRWKRAGWLARWVVRCIASCRLAFPADGHAKTVPLPTKTPTPGRWVRDVRAWYFTDRLTSHAASRQTTAVRSSATAGGGRTGQTAGAWLDGRLQGQDPSGPGTREDRRTDGQTDGV